MKNIQTMVDDLYQVIQGQGGWTESISTQMGNAVADTANKRFSKPQEHGVIYLYLLLELLVSVSYGTKLIKLVKVSS